MKNIFKSDNKAKVILFCLLIFSTTISAKKLHVKLKKDKVILNETEVFSYKLGMTARGETRSLYNKNSNEEVIFIKVDNGGTTSGDDCGKDDFATFNFLKEKIKVERTGSFHLFKDDIAFLYLEGIFDLQGNLNLEKITLFKEKYDENISEKIVIPR